MKPVWAVRSGRFSGYISSSGLVYDSSGEHVGRLVNGKIYSNSGRYIGEIYKERWVGVKNNYLAPMRGVRAKHASKAVSRYADRSGIAIATWSDPNF